MTRKIAATALKKCGCLGIVGGNVGRIGGREFGIGTPHVDGKNPVADAEQNTDQLEDATNQSAIREMCHNEDKKPDSHSNARHNGSAREIMLRVHKVENCRNHGKHGCSASAVPAVEFVEVFTHERSTG